MPESLREKESVDTDVGLVLHAEYLVGKKKKRRRLIE